MERRVFTTLLGMGAVAAALGDFGKTKGSQMKKDTVLLEASTWSELAEVIPKCMEKFKEQGEYIVFGYASIIGNHGDIKNPEGPSAKIPNKKAILPGMEVAMNVYAVGPNELRGTTDWENGVYNVGVYAGIEPALTAEGYSEGLNVKIAESEAIEGLSQFIKRELGSPPEGVTIADLFDPNSGAKEKLAAMPNNQFGLYKFQMVNTVEEGQSKAAVVVSTNEKSKYSAIGLTPIQAAHFILDGQGVKRPGANNSILGGAALDYFTGVIETYRKQEMHQPRMTEIQGAIYKLANVYDQAHRILENAHLSQADKATRIGKMTTELGVDVFSRVFDKGDMVAKRSDVDKKGFKESGLPITGEEKLGYISKLYQERKFDAMKGNQSLPSF